MKKNILLFSLFAISPLFSCASQFGAPDPQVMAEEAAVDVQSLTSEAIANLRRTHNFPWRLQMNGSLSNAGYGGYSNENPIPEPDAFQSQFDVLRRMTRRIFDVDNLIERPTGGAVFRVRGVDVCQEMGAIERCIENVDSLQLAVRTSGDLDLTLLVGPERHELGTFRLRKGKSLSWESDISQVERVVAFVQSIRNDVAPSILFQGQGKLELKLEKNGDSDFSYSVTVGSDIQLSLQDERGKRVFSTQQKSPVFFSRIDGNNHQLTLQSNLGMTRYTGPSTDLGGGHSLGTLEAILGGFSFETTIEDDKPIRIQNIGLGDVQTAVRVSGSEFLTVDLNELDGRRFDLEFMLNSNDLPKVTFLKNATLKTMKADEMSERQTFHFAVIPNSGGGASVELLNTQPLYSINGGKMIVALNADSAQFESGACFAPTTTGEAPGLIEATCQP